MQTDYILPPTVTPQNCLAGVLQQLQSMIALVEPKKNATLADVAQFVAGAQIDFGTDAELERVIQLLVARDLKQQVRERPRNPAIQEPLVLVCQES